MIRAIVVVMLMLWVGTAFVVASLHTGGEETVKKTLAELGDDPLLQEGYTPEREETASFAMGCFWGPDGLFGVLPGVVSTRVGYAGGSLPRPTYHDLGDHAETVQIDYDPSVIGYEQLLELFWANHNPYARPYSPQYRSMILYHSEEQRRAAEAFVASASGERDPSTEIEEIGRFTRAEDYHQKYRLQTASRLRRTVEGLIARFGSFDAFVDSTVAARLNGYVAGWAPKDRLERQIDAFGLSEEAKTAVLEAVR